jgi:hypothetical protein
MKNLQTEAQRLTQAIKNSNYDELIHIGSLENNNYEIRRYDEDDDMYYYKNVDSTEEFLCFVDNDLVRYNEVIEIYGYKPLRDENGDEYGKGEEDSCEYIDVIGKNDDIDDQLGVYIETFYSMDEIEEHFEQKPKFLNYIKTNLMSWVKK